MVRKWSVLVSLLVLGFWFAGCGESTSSAAKADAPAKAAAVNLALNKAALCSSVEKANKYNGNIDSVAKFAVDGDRSTRWSSDWRNDQDPGSAWLSVDLGAKMEIKTIVIYWDDPAYAKAFSIDVSDDGKTWTTAKDVTGNLFKKTTTKLDNPVTTQFVKITCKIRGSEYGYSNLGAGLLGHLLAYRAGTDYESLIGIRITRPLNMPNTGITLSSMGQRFATGHNAILAPVAKLDLPTLAGAGALNFKTSRAIVSHAYLPLGLKELLGISILLLKDPSTIDPDNFVASNLAALLPGNAPLWQMAEAELCRPAMRSQSTL